MEPKSGTRVALLLRPAPTPVTFKVLRRIWPPALILTGLAASALWTAWLGYGLFKLIAAAI